ncbi:LysR family transcriptional regulator [Sphingobium sp. H39-3-25]|uniref:LysR family transcriptional regulator n=1 Tax=Sphingobium arseniciresistens TaxID=3030834 RepID=UPI0023B93A6F|nr:LysR family transcriptional regulator [Sphingobium arseniciresistens]
MTRPTLNEIAAFCAVATLRSFRRAADELGITPSTLSHTIRNLEMGLGVRLLHRTTRSVAPTEAGLELLSRMEPLISAFDTAVEHTRRFRDTVSGTVRISAAAPAVMLLLDRFIPALNERHPDVHVEFVTDGRLVDIVDNGCDAGIRFDEAVPRDMIGVPLAAPSRFVVVAARSYLERYQCPVVPQDLHDHNCIRMRLTTGRMLQWAFAKDGDEQTIDPKGRMTFGDIPSQLAASAAGLGLAYIWETAARSMIDQRSLCVVLDDWATPVGPPLLYYSGNRRTPPALRALIDIIQDPY